MHSVHHKINDDHQCFHNHFFTEKDIACSITLTDQLFTSQVYKPEDDEE